MTDKNELDKIELQVKNTLEPLGIFDGLLERVMSSLPEHSKMKPLLHPALRVAYALMSITFAFAAWRVDLPTRFGVTGVASKILLIAFFVQATFGATLIGLLLWREQRDIKRHSGEAAFSPQHARRMWGAVASAVIFGTAWHVMGGVQSQLMQNAIRLAKIAAISLMFTTILVAIMQLYLSMRGRNFSRQLRMVEAGGLFVAGIICAASAIMTF